MAFKKDLHDLEIVIDQGNATDDILYKRMEIIKDIQEAEKVDNLEVAQKAKIKWAIEGDENTKFYHGILNMKRNQLGIRGVLKDGIDISYQEIKPAVWDYGIDKSPGPDGFTFGFIRRYWSLIEKDVVAAVQHFFTSSNFPKGCNASFIALIPKIPDAKLVKDFHPISLIGSLYKIIEKILANRLVGVLGDLVSEVQSAFVADRQTLDDPLILNECFEWASGLSINFSKSKFMGLAVSIEKVKEVTRHIGCGILNTLFSFLVLKVGGCMSRIKSWDAVIDKMVNRLSKWKMKTLSIGGRLTLLKAVFRIGRVGNIGYTLICCDIIKEMNRRIKNFLNSGKHDQVVAIIKSCSSNVIGDLTVTMKDLSGTILGTIHHKVIGEGGYEKDIIVEAALILAKVLAFSPKPSKHYLNITIRNVVKIFCKDTIPESESGSG
nr:RNA-directed DNA polymerase, eukaryota, reverse transcriptase zinc-binding domain protein [Tanacetum cinerariifolium]